MPNVIRSVSLLIGVGLLLVASEAQTREKTVPKAEQSAFTRAAIACAEKARTTADTRACWISQIDKARKALDQEYQRFLKAIPSDKQKDVDSAQEAWRRYSTSQCDLYMSVFEGTMWHPLSDQCVLRKVEERTGELAEVRREYEAGP
jgi:uncharacterized protein YecT (DUF1311 family)